MYSSMKVSGVAFRANFISQVKGEGNINNFFPYSVLGEDASGIKKVSKLFAGRTKDKPGTLILENVLDKKSVLKLVLEGKETSAIMFPATDVLDVNKLVSLYKRMFNDIKLKLR